MERPFDRSPLLALERVNFCRMILPAYKSMRGRLPRNSSLWNLFYNHYSYFHPNADPCNPYRRCCVSLREMRFTSTSLRLNTVAYGIRRRHLTSFSLMVCIPTVNSKLFRSLSGFSKLGTNISERDTSDPKKLYFDGYTSSGIDVLGLNPPRNTTSSSSSSSGGLYEAENQSMVRVVGSFLAFPNSLYMWNSVQTASDVTLESLALLFHYEPKIDVLLLGFPRGSPRLSPQNFESIRQSFAQQRGTIVEQLDWVRISLPIWNIYRSTSTLVERDVPTSDNRFPFFLCFFFSGCSSISFMPVLHSIY